MKKLIAALLLVSMVFCLCACGDSQDNNEIEPPVVTDPVDTDPVDTDPEVQGVTYTIKVVDEGGNPVAGAMVQLCSDLCLPKITDANGLAVYENQEELDNYKASVTSYPTGYEQLGEETDFYFGEGVYEVTITVKAVA